SADGSFKASTINGTIVGKFYLQAGKLRYRSIRTTPAAMPSAAVLGTASVSEDKDKTTLMLMPDEPNYLGKAEYERVQERDFLGSESMSVSNADERDGHRVGAAELARDAAGGVGGAGSEMRWPPVLFDLAIVIVMWTVVLWLIRQRRLRVAANPSPRRVQGYR